MYQNFGEGQGGCNDADVAVVHCIKEGSQVRQVFWIFFYEVNERRCIEAYDCAVERIYPFHDERS